MTKQQQLIYSIVKASHSHPTAGEVYEQTRAYMPGIGIATVYRVLDKLSKESKIRRISVDGEKDRFDGNLTPHSHVICRLCGKTRDVSLEGIEEIIRSRLGSESLEVNIALSDICEECAKKAFDYRENELK